MQEQINTDPDEARTGDSAFYLCMSAALVAACALQITALVGTLRTSGIAPAPPEACSESLPVGTPLSATAAVRTRDGGLHNSDGCAVRASTD